MFCLAKKQKLLHKRWSLIETLCCRWSDHIRYTFFPSYRSCLFIKWLEEGNFENKCTSYVIANGTGPTTATENNRLFGLSTMVRTNPSLGHDTAPWTSLTSTNNVNISTLKEKHSNWGRKNTQPEFKKKILYIIIYNSSWFLVWLMPVADTRSGRFVLFNTQRAKLE